MSGGGGSGIGPGEGSGQQQDCASLRFTTSLAGPQPDVVAELGEDDVLEVALVTTQGRRRIAVLHDGDEAGAITTNTTALLRCLQEGFLFVAVVVAVEGGLVRVRVEVAR